MPSNALIRPAAKRDIVEQALHIAQDNPDAAEKFLDVIEGTSAMLAGMPEMGALRSFNNPALEGIRMWPVKGFEKHLIFYCPTANGIEVIRILHAARDIQGVLEADE